MARPETGRYRKAVDEGRTGDKVGHPDPAAAPLETDAESSGAPTAAPSLEDVLREQEDIHTRHPPAGPPLDRWVVLVLILAMLMGAGAVWATFGAT